jgi:hypothetical protein
MASYFVIRLHRQGKFRCTPVVLRLTARTALLGLLPKCRSDLDLCEVDSPSPRPANSTVVVGAQRLFDASGGATLYKVNAIAMRAEGKSGCIPAFCLSYKHARSRRACGRSLHARCTRHPQPQLTGHIVSTEHTYSAKDYTPFRASLAARCHLRRPSLVWPYPCRGTS